MATGQILTTVTGPGSRGVRAVAYSPDGNLMATADRNGHAYLWALPNYAIRAALADPRSQGATQLAVILGQPP